MGILSKESILGCKDLSQIVQVSVPEWGGVVCVRPMTGGERDAMEQAVHAKAGNLRALVCCYSTCDEDGKRLFSQGDIAKLSEKSSLALQRIFDAAMKLNRITDADVDELEKNSETTTS